MNILIHELLLHFEKGGWQKYASNDIPRKCALINNKAFNIDLDTEQFLYETCLFESSFGSLIIYK